jgi:hypothetical protein
VVADVAASCRAADHRRWLISSGGVTRSGEVRWDVRYRDDARQQRKRRFERKLDAQRFARSVETDLLRGEWIDPRRGQELFEVWAAMWMETLASRKPETRESYESIVRPHLLPRFAATPIEPSTTRACWPSSPGCSGRASPAPSATFATCCASCSVSPSDQERSR